MRGRRPIAALFAALLASGAAGATDLPQLREGSPVTVYFRSGGQITGTLVEQTDETLTLDRAGGRVRVRAATIREVDGEPAPTAGAQELPPTFRTIAVTYEYSGWQTGTEKILIDLGRRRLAQDREIRTTVAGVETPLEPRRLLFDGQKLYGLPDDGKVAISMPLPADDLREAAFGDERALGPAIGDRVILGRPCRQYRRSNGSVWYWQGVLMREEVANPLGARFNFTREATALEVDVAIAAEAFELPAGIAVKTVEETMAGLESALAKLRDAGSGAARTDARAPAPSRASGDGTGDHPAVERLIADLRSRSDHRFEAELLSGISGLRAQPGRGGPIVVGRVVVDGPEDPRTVIAQMEILPGGYFADRVGDAARPIAFRLHGYAPLDVRLEEGAGREEIVYVGDVVLERLPARDLATVRGRISVDGPASAATVTAQIKAPANTSSGGTSPRRAGGWPPTLHAALDSSGAFRFDGLSPAAYTIRLRAPGQAEKFHEVSLRAGEEKDLGTIGIEAARTVRISYLASRSSAFSGAAPGEAQLRQNQKLRVPGDHWRESEEKWGRGYGDTFTLMQKDGRIYPWVFYQPARLADLGPGRLEDFLSGADSRARFEPPGKISFSDGHVYILDHQTFGYWLLFRVEVE